MRETVLVVILLFSCVLFAGCINSEPETYVVALDPALQPFSIESPGNGEPAGFDVEMLEWIARDQGIAFTYKFATLPESLEEVNAGTYDLRPSMIVTDARREIFDFSDSYIESGYTLVARKDSDLTMANVIGNDTVIAIVQASAYVERLREQIENNEYDERLAAGQIILKNTMDTAVYSVLSGESDITLCGDIVTVTQTKNLPALKMVGYLDGEISSAIGVPKGNSELVEKLNAGIANFRASPEYDDLKEKYSIPYLKDTYVVGIDPNNVPYTYLDENGTLTGFDYESLLWIADKAGFNVTFSEMDWSKSVNALIKGDISMWYSGMEITPWRQNRVTFSDPYLNGSTVVLAQVTNPVTKWEFEAGDAVVGTLLGTTDNDWVEAYFGDQYSSMLSSGKIVLVSNQSDLISALAAGSVDCILVNEVGSIQSMRLNGLRTIATYPSYYSSGVAMQNGNVALQEAINKGLADMNASGYTDELKIKYQI